ncbi:MAG TPA: N-acetyltransferase [Chromatiales bacterium]|nr:N-acetyltransferase [Chromatiales bacterium]
MEPARVCALDDIDAGEWNALDGTDQPFLRHEFLAALEHSGAVGPDQGWEPAHLVLRTGHGKLAGAMPLYIKTDSWGEFVFDFAWADAYHRAGLNYYPKLVSGIPFTPATGPRLLAAAWADSGEIHRRLLNAARALADELGASSLHILFPPPQQIGSIEQAGLLLRKDCQFHWHNHDYTDFDSFLDSFSAAKRKKVRRERRRVRESGVSFRVLHGHELDRNTWKTLMPLYASSFWRRGRSPYLGLEFFVEVAATLPDQTLAIVAEHDGEAIGTAICFRSSDTLYGRYWGASARYHSLHFETCYYQGIDYCIENGLQHFEPGTQGEHKVSRGFVPTETWSAHWLADPRFAAAVDDYLRRERRYINEYMQSVDQHLPYRRDDG